jgi:hypothetical protein
MDEKTLYAVGAKLVAENVNIEDRNAVRECLSNCALPTLYYLLSPSDLRRAVYAGVPVWLDGEPAKIIGFANGFATVRSASKSFEWSWTSVAHIVANGGHFES